MIVKPHLSVKYARFVSTAAMVAVLAGFQIPAGTVQAAADNSINSTSVTTDHDSANLLGHHHYLSSAERANDALLITEVKNALDDDGVEHDVAIVVDCDHGKILLSGVMKSTQDAKHAGDIAAGAPGVTAVKNQLTWH